MTKPKVTWYTVTVPVPGVVGDATFRTVGAVVCDDDPDVRRAVETYPDHFVKS